ncbi:MAG: O-antigen translocase [Leeuwenhoekiella sp.]|nr:O-antigen translocase [Leeuwenhoekiella sp.]
MLKYLRLLIAQNVLLKVSSFNAIGIFVRVVCGLITSKLIAFYLGASGMAILGDLRNFLSSVQSVSQLGISNGVIKYTAEYKTENPKFNRLVATALKIGLGCSIVVGGILVVFSNPINYFVFNGVHDYTSIIKITGFVLPLFTLNALLVNVINGMGAYKKVIQINVATNVLGVVVSALLIIYFNLFGALLALVISGVMALGITGVFLLNKRHYFLQMVRARIDIEIIKKLASYGGMTLFSAIASPWVYIAIRKHIIKTDGIVNAGYWDAMLRLSEYYMMFATTLMTLYFLPKLSAVASKKEFRTEVLNFYKTILPCFGVGLILIFLLKSYIIKIVFNASFLEMRSIFIWQLAGDFFRVASLVIAYQLVAKNKFWLFIGTQILSLSIIYLSSRFFIDVYGFTGAAMGHLLSYALYLLVMVGVFYKSLFGRL